MKRYIRLGYYLVVIIFTLLALSSIYGDNADSGTSTGLYLTYGLMLLAIVSTVGAALYYMITHPKQGLRSLISIGILAGIFLLGYAFGPGEVTDKYISFGVDNASSSKRVDSGLIAVYILSGIAIIGAFYSEIRGMFK